jgi:L-asparagine permease
MPGAPFTSWLTLMFLLGVLVLMAFDYPSGTWTVAMIPVWGLVLAIGWRIKTRRTAHALAYPPASRRNPEKA